MWAVHCPKCGRSIDWRKDVTEAAKARVPETMHIDCPKHGPAEVPLRWILQNPVAKAG